MATRSIAQTLRQHHGIEHATVTLLSRRLPGVRLMAHSHLEGFTVFGEVETATLRAIVEEALVRLKQGQSELAIHPNCGTNLVTAGTLTGLAALLMAGDRNRSWWDRLPGAILGATVALLFAIPAGRWMQANVTTSADVTGLDITSVKKVAGEPMMQHRVTIGRPTAA